MELRDLIRDLFLFAATFRERLDRGQLPPLTALHAEAKRLFQDMDQRAQELPSLQARYNHIRYGLAGLLDEIVVSSTWPEAPNWPILELEYYQTNIAGNHVYELIQGLTPADVDLIEGYFYVLALGFRGQYAFEEEKWADALTRLYRQLPRPLEQGEFKLAPEAYRVIRRKAQRLDPLFSLWRAAIIFLICMVMVIVAYQTAWISVVNKAEQKTRQTVESVRDPDLKQSLREVTP